MSSADKTPYLYKDDKHLPLFSLSKFVGKKIVDVAGWPADPFGGAPLFQIWQIVFEDGSTVYLDGEHDVAYIGSSDKLQNMDDDTLESFIDRDE
jgi:hypothetical protein